MADDQTVHATVGLKVDLAPFAFQHYAKDFYEAYKQHNPPSKFSPARLFLIGRSIELASKGLHLAQGRTADDLRKLDHDLEKACDPTMLAVYGITLALDEITELKKANEYYKRKGFEYFLFKLPGVSVDRSGPQMALRGWPELPDEARLEGILNKLLAPQL